MMSALSAFRDKATSLEDMRNKWETMIDHIRKGESRESLTLPDFEAYGWARLEEFLERLEDAINSPLLEEARSILSNAKIVVTQKVLDELKKGLSVRREGLVDILEVMAAELKDVSIEKVLHKCNESVRSCLEEGRWDNLVPCAKEWKSLSENLESLFEVMNEKTLLYNGIFERALDEGPTTELIKKLDEVKSRAFQIGGQKLSEHLRFENISHPLNPLGKVDSNLTTVAEKKEDINRLQGEEIEIEELLGEDEFLETLLAKLEAKYNAVKRAFNAEQQKVDGLIRKYNDLANLLRKPTHLLPENANLKQLKQTSVELEDGINKLENELTGSFSQDAKIFIENLSEGRLPENWNSEQIVTVLQELINKKLSFKIIWRE
jgi:hypothetical protein